MFPGDSAAFFKGSRGTHGSFAGKFGESDLRATEEELEQAVRTRLSYFLREVSCLVHGSLVSRQQSFRTRYCSFIVQPGVRESLSN